MRAVQKHIILSFIILFSGVSSAETIIGEGYGKDIEEARNEAMATLASSIYVQIESDSSSYKNNDGVNQFSITSHASSNLPLFGLDFICNDSSNIFCTVSMDTVKALPLYQQKIKTIGADINERMARIENLPKAEAYGQLQKVVADYEQFNKLRMVVLYLSGHKARLDSLSFSRLEVQERLAKLEAKVATLKLAAKLLARDIKDESLYINPPALVGSSEVTPFATAMKQALSEYLNSTASPSKADYHYSGEYQEHGKGMRLSYSLSDRNGNTLKAHVIELAPSSYEQYRITALVPDFDALLHKGYAVASDFKAQLNTSKGSSQLQFKNGESAQLLVKLNKAGYFYMVGHSKSTELELSYLIDLTDAGGKRKFIYYVGADDVNKWVSLGEFEAAPPFGVESIQLIASEKDLIDKLPNHKYDRATKYYVISNNIEESVSLTRSTRGLKKKEDTLVAESAETVLLFTTEN